MTDRVLRRRPLLWRIFLGNATVLAIAAVLLAVTPVTISSPIALTEAGIIVASLAAMLAANVALLRHTLQPFHQLVETMDSVDPLRPGQRLSVAPRAGRETAALTDAFNGMLERLESERLGAARRALEAQEAERLRIARELHDQIGQTLSAAAIHVERAAGRAEPARQELEAVAASIRASLDDVRRISRELRPEALDDLGLGSALVALCRRIEDQGGLVVEREMSLPLPALTAEHELVVYRIVQESLTNIMRHARATRATLTVAHGDDWLVVTIADDGRGLGPHVADGTGIAGMRERAMLAGGELSIGSSPNRGTTVRLQIPLTGGAR